MEKALVICFKWNNKDWNQTVLAGLKKKKEPHGRKFAYMLRVAIKIPS